MTKLKIELQKCLNNTNVNYWEKISKYKIWSFNLYNNLLGLLLMYEEV